MHVAVNNHALPVYKNNRITSLLCIFESTIVNINLVDRNGYKYRQFFPTEEVHFLNHRRRYFFTFLEFQLSFFQRQCENYI